MLYFVIAWIFLSVTCFLIGTAFIDLVRAECFDRISDRFFAAVWLGLIILSLSLLTSSFIASLSAYFGILVAIFLSFVSFLLPETKADCLTLYRIISPKVILVFITLEFLVSALTTKQVTWLDTGLYHFGAIRWLSEFGAVPGIALIHHRFSFTSSWFALAAPLNAEVFGSRVSAVTNGFIFFIAIVQFLVSLVHIFTKKIRLSDCFIIVWSLITIPFIIFFKLMLEILVSPSPDLPVLLLTGIIAWAILVISNQKKISLSRANTPSLDPKTIPLILAAGAVTIKITALPILAIISIYYFWGERFSIKRLFWGSVIIILTLSPMFISRVIASGCPLFPSTFMCLDLPWTIPTETAMAEIERIKGWGKWFGTPPPNTNYLFWNVSEWFKGSKSNQLMTLLIGISVILVTTCLKNFKSSQIMRQVWLLSIGFLGIIFITLQAPQLRLGAGYFILIPSALISSYFYIKVTNIKNLNLFLYFRSKISKNWFRFLSLFIGGIFAQAIAISIVIANSEGNFYWFLPPELPTVQVIPMQVNDVKYVAPINNDALCWAAELPCTFMTGLNIQLLEPSEGISAGFIKSSD